MRKTIKFFVIAAVMAAVPIIGLTAPTAAYAGTGIGCRLHAVSSGLVTRGRAPRPPPLALEVCLSLGPDVRVVR